VGARARFSFPPGGDEQTYDKYSFEEATLRCWNWLRKTAVRVTRACGLGLSINLSLRRHTIVKTKYVNINIH